MDRRRNIKMLCWGRRSNVALCACLLHSLALFQIIHQSTALCGDPKTTKSKRIQRETPNDKFHECAKRFSRIMNINSDLKTDQHISERILITEIPKRKNKRTKRKITKLEHSENIWQTRKQRQYATRKKRKTKYKYKWIYLYHEMKEKHEKHKTNTNWTKKSRTNSG